MEFPILKASKKDWKEIFQLEQECFPTADVFKPTQILHLLSSKTSLVFVIRVEGKIIAHIIGLLRKFRIPSGRIYKVSVSQGARGKGLASKLIFFVEEKFQKMGMKRVCAEVRKSNLASQKMFLKNGYELKKVLPRYYSDGEDAFKLWKTF
jgi:[ribosomal protein S18]-alanine N-acetyltransferase